MDNTIKMKGSGASALKQDKNGDWVGTPAKGSEVIITLPGVSPAITPVSAVPLEKPFGVN
ncbi:MAG: hypothetical protein LBV12_00520 [Puniceicoccales bacterium]|jgi:hypothetical protein|nr:hypothetical protein [Puniceicoccales bacterium]